MSELMDEQIKRWTAKRKSALVLEIIQGKTTVAEASKAYDLPPSEIETWVDDGKRGMENALRANPQDVREQYELCASSTSARSRTSRRPMVRRCWSCEPEKSCSPCWARTRNDCVHPAGTESRRF